MDPDVHEGVHGSGALTSPVQLASPELLLHVHFGKTLPRRMAVCPKPVRGGPRVNSRLKSLSHHPEVAQLCRSSDDVHTDSIYITTNCKKKVLLWLACGQNAGMFLELCT